MASAECPETSLREQAIELIEEALGILDKLGLTLAASRLAMALDTARTEPKGPSR